MKKEQWINEVYKLLCKSQGEPIDGNERKNLRDWATSIYNQALEDSKDLGIEMLTPQEALDDELSCA